MGSFWPKVAGGCLEVLEGIPGSLEDMPWDSGSTFHL